MLQAGVPCLIALHQTSPSDLVYEFHPITQEAIDKTIKGSEYCRKTVFRTPCTTNDPTLAEFEFPYQTSRSGADGATKGRLHQLDIGAVSETTTVPLYLPTRALSAHM